MPEAIAPDSAFAWGDEFLLGFGPMDEVHEEFVRLLATMVTAAAAELQRNLDEIALHLDRHFALEDRWMRETQFPPRDCHIDEHAAVMQSVREVQALLAFAEDDRSRERARANARALAGALRDWFPGHATHLDSALSHWMCKLRLGGKPVVLRRNRIVQPGL